MKMVLLLACACKWERNTVSHWNRYLENNQDIPKVRFYAQFTAIIFHDSKSNVSFFIMPW